MRYENKTWERDGMLFKTPRNTVDLSALRYLHSGVDTVKQLFNCVIRDSVISKINKHFDDSNSNVINIGGVDWLFSKSGKTSGYQYIFKNIDYGFVVLLKSFYIEANEKGSHLKIEVTPQMIDQCTPYGLDLAINNVATLFASELEHSGIAAHICVDMKGLQVPDDLEKRLVTHSKRNFRFNDISHCEMNLNETAVIYGNSQSYTFGNANALQMCLYDKTAQAKKIDKLDFWEGVWRQVGSVDDPFEPEYQKSDQVHRLEFRFHHSIINEFVNGTKIDDENFITIKCFSDLSMHLTALWKYALNSYRLQHSSTYVDPLWQALTEDIKIYCPAPDLLYKRAAKKPSDSSRRNVAYWLGNVIKLFSRINFTLDHVVKHIYNSGLEAELYDYFMIPYDCHDLLQTVLTEFVSEKMKIHSLNGVAA